MSFRYIGSKARVVDAISQRLGDFAGTARFIDMFCGTGVVAEAAAELGWDIHLNDNLHSAVQIAAARLIGVQQAQFKFLGGYDKALSTLNGLKPIKGFIWKEYSPATAKRLGFERRYFSESNAGRIDAIRARIRAWNEAGMLTTEEERLLIADLLSAVNRVANIAGTYGCFLSTWQQQANERIQLRPRVLRREPCDVTTSVMDARDVQVKPNDLVYLDPPYTKRQYAAYYHLPETISLGDTPVVEGVSGLRPWKSKASEYCYKGRALPALLSVISGLDASRVLLSYSEDGHIPIDALTKALSEIGRVTPDRLMAIGRYRPNQAASKGAASVGEYLIEIVRHEMRVVA